MKLTKVYAPGEKIVLSELITDDSRSRYKPVTYTVVQQYPHHVLCVDESGNRRCINNAELLNAGVITALDCVMPGNRKTRERNWWI